MKIGESVLYVAGALGMALISKTKQLEYVTLWSNLCLPEAEGPGETTWGQQYQLNYWMTGVN